jgi:HTH-type transcriptional regulator / antitoxin HipB
VPRLRGRAQRVYAGIVLACSVGLWHSKSRQITHRFFTRPKKYIEKRKATNPEFAEGFEEGYENFRIGAMLKQARLEAGLTQDEVASAIGTRKTAISRLENHIQDVKLSTIEKYVKALGKRIEIKIA